MGLNNVEVGTSPNAPFSSYMALNEDSYEPIFMCRPLYNPSLSIYLPKLHGCNQALAETLKALGEAKSIGT